VSADAQPPFELGTTGAEIYRNTRPATWAETVTDYAWARFVWALSELLDPVASVTRPEDGSLSWTVLADPHRVPEPWLRVLAQWAGVRRPDAFTPEQLRELIAAGGPGFWRGTRRGITAAIAHLLPPGAPIYFEERADGEAYKIRIFTYTFSGGDEAAIRAAIHHQMPAGLFPFIYEVRVGQTWAMLNARKANWGEVRAQYANWYEVLHDEPLESP
jgi:phage tail-like protein